MKTFNFKNHRFQISKEGILFWHKKKIAIISDLHLEKGSSFALNGQFLPTYDSEETLSKIFSVIKNFDINKIILLGDTFHDHKSFNRMSEKARFLFESLIKKYDVKFIIGNHEKNIKIKNINFYNEYIIDGIYFIHEALKSDKYQITGHFHPVATMKISNRKITEKCLIHSSNKIILPSFGEYTGGLNIKNEIFKEHLSCRHKIYLLTKNSVYTFPSELFI